MALTLKQQLGPVFGVAVITNAIIGSGIFISPSLVFAGTGGSPVYALLMWLFAGIFVVLGSLSFIELSFRVRKSGGLYIFIREAFGDNMAFTYLWTDLIVLRPLSIALKMLATGEYILRPIFLDCPNLSPIPAVRLFGLLVLGVSFAVNCYSMRHTSNMIIVITLCKVGVLLLIIGGGILHLAQGNLDHFDNAFETFDFDPAAFILAFYTAILSYFGGSSITFIYEEFKNPKRILVISTIIGHVIPLILYLLANISYFAVLTKEEILSGVTVAVVFGDRKLGYLKWLILPCIAISTTGNISSNLMVGSRSVLVASREGQFPRFLSMIHMKRRTPIPALVLISILVVIMTLNFNLLSVLTYYTFLKLLFYGIAIMGLLRIRKTHNPENVLKLPLAIPIVFVLVLAMFAVNTVIFAPKVLLLCLLVGASALLVKFVLFCGKDPKSSFGKSLERTSDFFYKISYVLFSCEVSTYDADKFI